MIKKLMFVLFIMFCLMGVAFWSMSHQKPVPAPYVLDENKIIQQQHEEYKK